MGILEQKQEDQLKKIFEKLTGEVRLLYFTESQDCAHCQMGEEIIQVLPPLSDKIKVEVHDVVKEPEVAAQYGVDKYPGIAVIGARDYGVRFYGIPAGHEFTAFIQDILYVSAGDPGLSPKIMEEVKKIDRPVHLEVMTSLTCPYCPMAVRAAHRLAMANDNIRADMVDTAEFPAIALKYKVAGVPDTVINGDRRVVGAMPELELTYFIQDALGIELSEDGKAAVAAVNLQIAASHHDHDHDHRGHDHEHEHEAEHQPQPAPKRESGPGSQPKPAAKAPGSSRKKKL